MIPTQRAIAPASSRLADAFPPSSLLFPAISVRSRHATLRFCRVSIGITVGEKMRDRDGKIPHPLKAFMTRTNSRVINNIATVECSIPAVRLCISSSLIDRSVARQLQSPSSHFVFPEVSSRFRRNF